MSTDAPGRDLEDVLADIDGLSRVMLKLAAESDEGWLFYLAARLQDHHDRAHDAFCRMYKLDDYSPSGACARLARLVSPG